MDILILNDGRTQQGADATSSTKDTHNHIGEESNSRLQLASSLNVLEELDTSSPLSNLNGDQPFDILQKSLQEANITQQTLQEEADLAAAITSTQEFPQAQIHPTSFSQVSGISFVRGLSQQQMNVTPSPILQQVLRTPFVNNEANVQPGFFQQMGINSVAIQHLPSSNPGGGIGPVHLIGSLDSQPPVMTFNQLEGSQFISKDNGQLPAVSSVSVGNYNMSSLPNHQPMSLNPSGLNETGGLLLQRRVTALNGNTYYGASNIGQVPQPMSVHFSGNNIPTALPLHNIILQRGPVPSQPKISLSIQPKPAQINQQQTIYNINNLELQTAFKIQNEVSLQQQQQMQHNLPFGTMSSSQNSAVGSPMGVNIAKQQVQRKTGRSQVLNPTGSSILIQPPIGQHEPLASQSQFFIPSSLALSMNSTVQHLQTANGQILQNRTVPTQLVTSQVASESAMTNRNSSGTTLATQSFSGQFLNQNSAGQLTSGQGAMEQVIPSSGQLLSNHGSSQLATGQVPLQQASQMLFNVPTCQGVQPTVGSNINTGIFKQSGQNTVRGRSFQNQLTVTVAPSSVCSSYVSTVQSSVSTANSSDHVTQTNSGSNLVVVCQGEQSLVTVQSAQQQCQQQLGMNHIFRITNPYHQNANLMQPSRQVSFSRTEMPVTQTSSHQHFLCSQASKKMIANKQEPVTSQSLVSLGHLSNQVSASLFGSQTPPNSVQKAHAGDGLRQSQIPSSLTSSGILGKNTCLAMQMSDGQLHKAAGTLQQHLGQIHSLQGKILGPSEMQKISQFDGQIVGQKRPASKQLTKESLILQQLQEEQRNVLQPDYKTPFRSQVDAMQRLLPYHVFQGNLPSQKEFQKVDNEFEDISVQLLKRTQMMLSKYRKLLLDDAMRVNPSAEMVMIDRVFNQDEKVALIQDKRFSLEDRDGYLANFCCSSSVFVKSAETQQLTTDRMLHKSSGINSRQSTSENTTISQKSEPSRLAHLASSVASEIKAAMNSPIESPHIDKLYNSSKELKLTIKPEKTSRAGTQSKSSKSQEWSDSGNVGSKSNTSSSSDFVEIQSTKVCEPVVGTFQICDKEENRFDMEKKHTSSNSCDKVSVESQMKEGQNPGIHQINNSIKLEHDEGDSQLPRHDQSQDKSAKNSKQQEFTSVQNKDAKEGQCDTSLHEHLESAINSILDLQQAQKPSDSAINKNNSSEIETPHFSALAPVENYVEKCTPDHNEGVRETDSILEAAVNSILEC
ncbi:BRD4-interacting chromatin-remodeling complex-associated protein-like isoform X2 [Narcine bancroftii]|uniref:BRD4-interacting chromatin-remodeling complex-associated protein-like isoform X2 n=1 Tax=Narcine bancroftii TaxID=1343680 RepID=UPI0038310881